MPASPTNEIVIGQIDSFSGPQANFGVYSRSGIQLAVAKVNEEGGIEGKKVRLISLDDHGKPEQSKVVVKKLIFEKKVKAILAPSASSRSLAVAPFAQDHQIPMIASTATNPSVTEVGDYIFRSCFIDTFQGAVMARFVRETLKAKKVAILREVGSEYSLGLASFFKEKFVSLGGQIVRDESYREGDIDFKRQLTAIRPMKPAVIYVPGYYTDVANIISQARKMGIEAIFAGGDGWDSNEVYKIDDGAEYESYFSNHYAPQNENPVHTKFVAAYKKKFKVAPTSGAALGYDAAMVLLDAMKRAKSTDGSKIRAEIARTKNYPGVTGEISLDAKRNAIKSVVIFKVAGKKTTYIQTINP